MPERRRGRPPHPDLLTPAERRVLEELRKGGTNAEIAIRIGPETVKTHVSNMLAKLELEDRHELAAWREDAPRRRWLLAPFLLRPLVAVGIVAGVAVVIAVILILLALVRGEREGLYVEGVGEIEGPVAVFLVAETESLALHQRIAAVVEPHQLLLGTRIASPFDWDRLPWDQLPATLFTAVDLSSGARWPLEGVSSPVVLARDRLVAWDDESIRRLALDGQVEAVLFQPGRPFSDPILSPTGLLIAVTTTGSVPQAMGRVVIIELHSGEEVLCVREEDTPIAEIARMLEVDPRHLELEIVRWSTDGSALWVQAMLNSFPVAHVVIELGGTVHTYPSLEVRSSSEQVFAFAFSPDLRFLVRGRLHERGLGFTERFEDGTPYLRSLEVVEVSTGRELAAITADANTLVHLVGPVDGRVEFARFPEDDQGVPVYVLEVATGAVVRQDDPDPWRETRRAEFSEEHAEHNLAILGHCFETRLDLRVCHDTVEEAVEMADSYRLESPTGREIWRLIGITWLD